MRTALALIVLATALLVVGCGGSPATSEGDDLAAGKALFVNGNMSDAAPCAACHTLDDAGSQGLIGPNLDDAFGPAREQGFSVGTFEQVVREQIEIPGTPTPVAIETGTRIAMPSRDDYGMTDDEANDIAYYVATCSGLNFLPEDDPDTAAAVSLCAAVAPPGPPAPAATDEG